MKRALILVFILFVAITMYASERSYVQGTLISIDVGQTTVGLPTKFGTMIAQDDTFQVSVRVGDLIYTVQTGSKDVRNFTIGDPIQVNIGDKNMYLKGENGKEVKARILTKTRASTAQ